jgi:exosortase/archaeosortase family protein
VSAVASGKLGSGDVADRGVASRDLVHMVGAFAVGLAAVTMVILRIRAIAMMEADVSSWLIRVTGLAESRSVGTAVIYHLGHRWVGFAITGGCSVALLMIPPFILSAILIGIRRVSWLRGVVAAASATALLIVVNQIRLFVIASAMQWWGFQSGYERSHVLIGSGITTIGLVLVTILFVIFLGRQSAGSNRRARRAR